LNGKPGRGLTLAFFLLCFDPAFSCAETPGPLSIPRIARLDSSDTGFRQYLADVEIARGRLFDRGRGGESPAAFAASLTVYQYTPAEGEDIFSIAARCAIPYAALASLNRLSHPVMLESGAPLLLPSGPGLYIPSEPASDLERLLASARFEGRESGAALLRIADRDFYFFPGADFSPTERAFFLNAGFRFPLRNFTLTSGYGPRSNPFTGNVRLHAGLDLAAPAGTGVFAAADGLVTEIGEDPVYGLYIVIRHSENWASLYGHLQKAETTLRSAVRSGSLIGRVGSSGQSTGPHLHFELRRNGQAQNPGKFLFRSEP
jgi:murein DD-endopeptidase MepM/ murein hydrolase activator NlpD